MVGVKDVSLFGKFKEGQREACMKHQRIEGYPGGQSDGHSCFESSDVCLQ